MKQLVCIGCPRGCRLEINEQTLEVNGNFCPTGAEYGKNELVSPMRTVTATVNIEGGIHARLAVRTDKAVPKSKMLDVVAELNRYTAHSPVRMGDMLIKNVAGTDANIIASRDM